MNDVLINNYLITYCAIFRNNNNNVDVISDNFNKNSSGTRNYT